ncbi:AMP-binding protein [Janibacter terrae]|uniref:AMP-binding protein n=1 Tax=Janibacter terrae TaxID=103817 RepID=A0ABZ2FC83_9MICO
MPSSEIVHVLAAEDPVAAFGEAARAGRPIALATSGTSGHARTIVRTTGSWVGSFPAVSALTGTTAGSRVHAPGPITSSMNLFAAVHAGWARATMVDELADATHAHLTPSALRRVLATRPQELAGTHVVVAGDRVDAATREKVLAAGGGLSHYYGAAELSLVAWGEHADALRPFPSVEVRARDGELWVRSPYVSRGYLEPGQELRTRPGGWVTVGDRGEVGGGVVRVHGREGGITTAGATVTVADVERVLRPHAEGEVVVVGLPHTELGEVVACAVTVASDADRLRRVARAELTTPQRPRRWVHLETLPVTPNDKVDRGAVRARLVAAGS